MKVFILLMIAVLMYAAEEISVGDAWEDAKVKHIKDGWSDTLTKFELEKGFSDKGGKIYSWNNPGGDQVYFVLLPLDDKLQITEMQIPNDMVAGARIRIKILLTD